jgi:hypothetical protein
MATYEQSLLIGGQWMPAQPLERLDLICIDELGYVPLAETAWSQRCRRELPDVVRHRGSHG